MSAMWMERTLCSCAGHGPPPLNDCDYNRFSPNLPIIVPGNVAENVGQGDAPPPYTGQWKWPTLRIRK